MPTYDYKCKECLYTASITTRIEKEIQIPTCAKCKIELVRNYGIQAVKFKGAGFYTTDKGNK